MQLIALVAAALTLAMPAIATPLSGSSALAPRAGVNYLLTCDTAAWSPTASDAGGAAFFTLVCVKSLKCEHSIAPTISANEYIGSCVNCPAGISADAFGDCLTTPE